MLTYRFRSTESAVDFYKTFNGIPYNSFEPDSLCHAVWVSNVDWGYDGSPPLNHTELPTCNFHNIQNSNPNSFQLFPLALNLLRSCVLRANG